MRFWYPPGATPIDPDEAKGLILAHLTLQRELNGYEESNILAATVFLAYGEAAHRWTVRQRWSRPKQKACRHNRQG
jgi:hypothetical protein